MDDTSYIMGVYFGKFIRVLILYLIVHRYIFSKWIDGRINSRFIAVLFAWVFASLSNSLTTVSNSSLDISTFARYLPGALLVAAIAYFNGRKQIRRELEDPTQIFN